MTRRQLVRSFRDIADLRLVDQPVVTLFSGGLDSTYLLHRLRHSGARNIHAVSVDLGGEEAWPEVASIADRLGVAWHLIDARSDFVESFVRPAIAAQAVYLDTHPISSSLSRPLIAQVVLDVAREVDAAAVLHTANRSQNTLRRLNGAFHYLGFEGQYGSPYDLTPVDRDQKIKELSVVGLDEMSRRIVSGDNNLWCREFESGIIDNPEHHVVPTSLYRWTRADEPSGPRMLDIGFKAGVPVSVNGVDLPLSGVIATLNTDVGRYGIGRYSGLEHLADDVKVLEVREMPAAAILLRSYRHIESAVTGAEEMREKMHLEQLWVREALEGRWFGALRHACQSFIDVFASKVTGSVRWNLSYGRAETVSITADNPLYVQNREAWERTSIESEG
ncbi:argininosuccinate synthase-related protein [Streptomyces sp. NPDC091972]|uniref:argininosuccinate synthase-related protein n=1 Tax=Streptomyces sp. NPDC091972 TaxID=3366007 RepID=UPI00382D738F